MKTSVFIVDDHQIVREGFSMILDDEPDIVVLGTADSAASALEQIPGLRPDIVLMDIELPDQDGIATTRQLRRQCPGLKVIIVSSFSKQSIVEQALQADALGYVLKTNPPEELFQAIRTAATGRLFLRQEVSAGIGEGAPDNWCPYLGLRRKGKTETVAQTKLVASRLQPARKPKRRHGAAIQKLARAPWPAPHPAR